MGNWKRWVHCLLVLPYRRPSSFDCRAVLVRWTRTHLVPAPSKRGPKTLQREAAARPMPNLQKDPERIRAVREGAAGLAIILLSVYSCSPHSKSYGHMWECSSYDWLLGPVSVLLHHPMTPRLLLAILPLALASLPVPPEQTKEQLRDSSQKPGLTGRPLHPWKIS